MSGAADVELAWTRALELVLLEPLSAGKGAADIAFVIDAMDLLHADQVDTFCLVANDSDYTRLAMRLRESGWRVVVIGSKNASAAFSNACDRFTLLEVLVGAPDNEPPRRDDESGGVEASAGDMPALEDMLRVGVSARLDDDGWALLSRVGHQLVANHPTFDSRNYGFPRLGLLIRDTGQRTRDCQRQQGSLRPAR